MDVAKMLGINTEAFKAF